MAFVGHEGMIEIEMAEFFEWLSTKHANFGEVHYGVPRINKSNMTMEVDFSASTDGHPSDWAVKPKSVQQWELLK